MNKLSKILQDQLDSHDALVQASLKLHAVLIDSNVASSERLLNFQKWEHTLMESVKILNSLLNETTRPVKKKEKKNDLPTISFSK